VVKQLHRILNELKVENHPDKTYLGKSVNGFDFLGYLVNGSQLTVAKRQSSSPFYIGIRFMSSRKKKATSDEMASNLDRYVNRWQYWAAVGLQGIKIAVNKLIPYRQGPNPVRHVKTDVSK
jgi:RNA-directed DNA polymerase